MAIRLYDAVPSSNCDRVKIVLHEKGLAYETVRIDLGKGEQRKPEFLELNPYGKVPVIVDDGKVLFESCIINEYLDEKYPTPPLMPKDWWARGRVRVLIDYGLNYLHAQYWALRGELLKKEEEREPRLIEDTRQTLRDLLRYLEAEIGDKPYFMGELSLADIALVTRFFRMESYGVLPAPFLPRLGAWLRRMKERPSVRATL
ncbi:MAG: glutathione S-transferase family protein [Deltaproteobacteria bacterium]|nr:glutathione S-transferase family protein [Deltaproteobacteria bacterium]